MSALTLLRPPTKQEEEAEDFDPCPEMALAHAGVVLTAFHRSLQVGPYTFQTMIFVNQYVTVSAAAIRYSAMFPPFMLPLNGGQRDLVPNDEVTLRYHRGAR